MKLGLVLSCRAASPASLVAVALSCRTTALSSVETLKQYVGNSLLVTSLTTDTALK